MVQVHLCFEAPVDHERSTLTLKSREAVRQLIPRLEAATDCLFSIVGRLAPGAYDLVWEARLSGGQTENSTIPFTVKSSQATVSDEHVSRVESDWHQPPRSSKLEYQSSLNHSRDASTLDRRE
jgi:hypothetical protein